MRGVTYANEQDRFLSFVKITDKCWIWTGGKDPDGYGIFSSSGKSVRAHRHSYKIFNGTYNPKWHVLHSCDNPSCVNPEHLSLGDEKQNHIEKTQRGRNVQARKTHCNKGHEYSYENTLFYTMAAGYKTRRCKTCMHAHDKKRNALGRNRVAVTAYDKWMDNKE